MLALIAESGIVLFSIPRGNSQAENDAEEDDYSAESYIYKAQQRHFSRQYSVAITRLYCGYCNIQAAYH